MIILEQNDNEEYNQFQLTKYLGRKSTPISYDLIINWEPFFSSAPQAALDKFALKMKKNCD